jgi:hypothetical protein
MPDWKPEIRQRLAKLEMEPSRENAIVEELAQHLDESYAELLASGVSEADAYRRVRAELHDGGLLTHGLQRIERSTNPEPIVLGTKRSYQKSSVPASPPRIRGELSVGRRSLSSWPTDSLQMTSMPEPAPELTALASSVRTPQPHH